MQWRLQNQNTRKKKSVVPKTTTKKTEIKPDWMNKEIKENISKQNNLR